MYRQPFCSFSLAGVNLTEFGLKIPSPFVKLTLSNSEISSMTSWSLTCQIGADASKSAHYSSMEALLYSAAQADNADAKGIPVSFIFGWLDNNGNVSESISYQGFTLTFKVSISDRYIQYDITGYASIAMLCSLPLINVPAISGMVQPSAVLYAFLKAIHADYYYDFDIDRNDAVTLVSHGGLTTSVRSYVLGPQDRTQDNYNVFPGLRALAKSYQQNRSANGLKYNVNKLSQVINNVEKSRISNYLTTAFTDYASQCVGWSFWIEEPTTTKRGVIHFKSDASVLSNSSASLIYGTPESNILSISGSYDGVAYNMSNMNFKNIGFNVDVSGQEILSSTQTVNSWSSSLEHVFQTANIIGDINGLASQFTEKFSVVIPGNAYQFTIAQPVTLLVVANNVLSHISGIYHIMSVTHEISNTFITTLDIQRLAISSANEIATSTGIYLSGSSNVSSGYTKTSNIISTGKVDFGKIYPSMDEMYMMI